MFTETKIIINTLKENFSTLRNDYHVKSVGVFGSYARNEAGRDSDVDILVEFEKPVGFFLFSDLEDYLGGILNKKVDVVTKKALKPAIEDKILKETLYVR